ncbi:alpha/beta fold hydrolase [Corynebacterium qintianiae]|uniref:Alpha/beta fold hydrolase n=1 Tax=Corynebacterium qintianiae TaxID=2709392 RepID=A0A7T0KMK7_9CORY|nr:alpha/beta fold hydrolase [Corynebacterium qintianiae]QPK83234.1 alpha/beta fold hydrolase [Corynebacterium qintianiae]
MPKPTQHIVRTTDGEKLAAFTYGDPANPPLVLIHGYPDDHAVWAKVVPRLEHRFHVVAYDVRGAGESTHPRSMRSYPLSQLECDLASVADQVLHGRPFHLAAHDWGSIQSWEAATDPGFGGRILSFTSISGPCLDHGAHLVRRLATRPLKLAKLLAPSWYIGVFHLPVLAPAFWKFATPQQWRRRVCNLEGTDDIPLNPNADKNGRFGVELYRANVVPRLVAPRNRYAQCPVQAVVLTRDNFVRPEYIDEMRRWADDLEVTEIDSNHWAALSHSADVAKAIGDFALLNHN